ncbi:MAG: DUF3987 domain-containing protein, partial [Terrimicrobiaceae bacterium]
MNLAQAKQRLTVGMLWQQHNLPGKPGKSCRSPFREDQNPSFSVYIGKNGEERWKDFTTDEKGDAVDFLGKILGCDKSRAAREFLEIANGSGRVPPIPMTTLRPDSKMEPTRVNQPYDWEARKQAFTTSMAMLLDLERNFSREAVDALKEHGLIGAMEEDFAFPVHEKDGTVINCHFQKNDKSWRYHLRGTGARPLLAGGLSGEVPVWAFESPWDLCAALIACEWFQGNRLFAGVCTRGAANAGMLTDVVAPGSTVVLWPQNDVPGQDWGKEAARALPSCKVKVAAVPSDHKDAADWFKAGARKEEFCRALAEARLVHEAQVEGVHVARVEAVQQREAETVPTPDPGLFPVDCLSPVMQAVVKTVSDTFQIPAELPGMACLATWAGTIGKLAVVRGAVNGRDTHCNLYVFVGAPKSFGKGSAGVVVKPFLELSQKYGETFRDRDLPELRARLRVAEKETSYLSDAIAKGKMGLGKLLTEAERGQARDDLARAERDADELKRLSGGLPSYYTGSATGAALAQALQRNKEVTFSYSPEAGDMIRVAMGRYASDERGDFDLLLSGHTVEPFKESRISRGDVDLVPCITALWFCQLTLLRELMSNEEAFERGLTARALIFDCGWEGPIPHDDGTVRELHATAMEDWRTALAEMVRRREKTDPFALPCDHDAREVFRVFHNEAVDYRNGAFRDFEAELGRWRENAIRIAGGLALLDGVDRVTRGG